MINIIAPTLHGSLVTLKDERGHRIDVRVDPGGVDFKAFKAARAKGASQVKLLRFCPFCMANAEFDYEIPPGSEPARERPERWDDPVLSSPRYPGPAVWSGQRSESPNEKTLGRSVQELWSNIAYSGSAVLMSPLERALETWGRAHRALRSGEEIGREELERLEDDLGRAEKIFEREGKFMQRIGVLEDLVRVLKGLGREDEAQAKQALILKETTR